jgi:hypothetical protein
MFSDNFTRAQAPRNLDIGVVLGGAFGAIGKHWRAFAIYAGLLVVLPDVVVPYFTPVTRPGANLAELWANLGLVLLITTPSSFLFVRSSRPSSDGRPGPTQFGCRPNRGRP